MNIKNVSELDTLEELTGGEKVLLSTENGAKLFDASGVGGSSGGGGYDAVIVVEINEDNEYEASVVSDLTYDQLKTKFLASSLDIKAVYVESAEEGTSAPGIIVHQNLIIISSEVEGEGIEYYYGSQVQQYMGTPNCFILRICGGYTYSINGTNVEVEPGAVLLYAYMLPDEDGKPSLMVIDSGD